MKNKLKQPLVSVIMPAYNSQDYIEEAIKSILSQTYGNFELIIIDDASTDKTPAIIKKYESKHQNKIKTIFLKKNLNCGGDSCANEGLKIAKGKYIARMDADDISFPQRLEKQVGFLETNSSVFLVGSQAEVIDKNGKFLGEKIEPTNLSEIYESYSTFHPLIHPTCMFKRKINGKPFQYKIRYSANNDYYTFFSLVCKGFIFKNLDEKLIRLRIHGKNDTFVNIKRKFFNTLKIRLYMIIKYGYQPNLKAVFINLAQAATILILPEKMLLPLYFKMKGISRSVSLPNLVSVFSIKRFIN